MVYVSVIGTVFFIELSKVELAFIIAVFIALVIMNVTLLVWNRKRKKEIKRLSGIVPGEDSRKMDPDMEEDGISHIIHEKPDLPKKAYVPPVPAPVISGDRPFDPVKVILEDKPDRSVWVWVCPVCETENGLYDSMCCVCHTKGR